jgi:two-component system, cell cycle sensor histidine kinase and response regulator CckA
MSDSAAEEIRVLRERVAQLESMRAAETDPVARALMQHGPSFLTVVTPDGRLLATGRPAEAFGPVLGRSVFEFIDPAEHDKVRASFAKACATGEPLAYEAVGVGENAEPGHHYIVRVVPVREAGAVHALVLVPSDITERVRLERSLAENREALRLAVDAARIGLWRWDTCSNAVEWDARVREIWGVAEAPASYEAYLALIHPADRALVDGVVREALESGVYRTFEHRIVTSDERGERWILSAGTVLKKHDGKARMLTGGVLDITDQKRVATQIARAERVEAIGQLAAGVAHNFNNLLAAIIPNVELAIAGEAGRAGLVAALDAALQARTLVKSLLLLGRAPSARPPEPADAKEVLLRVAALCRNTFPREIDLVVSTDPASSFVSMPASDLEQVLLNLAFNARDAVGAAGARRIELRLERIALEAKAMAVRIQVADTGVGMSDAVRQRIFEPFFTTKPPHQGSGLGLANALARVKEALGRLDSESAPGQGTTMTLTLPEVKGPESAVRRSSTAPERVRPLTVLLVDDEPLVRQAVRRLLEVDGHKVLEASCAADAREVLVSFGASVDVVIMDQSMPTETGLEAAPSLRAHSGAPIVLFSGVMPVRWEQSVDAVLAKPATRRDLQRVLTSVCGR